MESLSLFFLAIGAGCLDTMAGGGGLLTLPALLLTGMSPIQALATNKLQGSMGTATASFLMLKHKRLNIKDIKTPMLFAFLGSATGTWIVQRLDVSQLNILIPIVLVIISVYFLSSGWLMKTVHHAKISTTAYHYIVIPCVGAYDGMFGPGTGMFFSFAGVLLRGKNLLDATANAKTLNFATNIAALIMFLLGGQLVWKAGLVMMIGQSIGAWLGSHLLYKIPQNLLRYLIVVVCTALMLKYLTD